MSKLLLVVALVLSALACDGPVDSTVVGDASADSLPPTRLDGGVDSLATPKVDTLPVTTPDTGRGDVLTVKTDTGTTPVTCAATIQGTVVTAGVTYSTWTGGDPTVSCEDPGYAKIIPAGVTCGQMLQGYKTVAGDDCCIDFASYGKSVISPFCSSRSFIGKQALCSASGGFIGWICTSYSP